MGLQIISIPKRNVFVSLKISKTILTLICTNEHSFTHPYFVFIDVNNYCALHFCTEQDFENESKFQFKSMAVNLSDLVLVHVPITNKFHNNKTCRGCRNGTISPGAAPLLALLAVCSNLWLSAGIKAEDELYSYTHKCIFFFTLLLINVANILYHNIG